MNNNLSNYKIVVTGSTGFVGQNLVSYLNKQNFSVKTVDRKQIYEHINLNSLDAIVHLAGKAHDVKNTSSANEYYEVNFELTKKLYQEFLASDAKKFIFISSVKAACDHLDAVLTEDIEPNPLTHYGKSKRMAEEFILSQDLPHGKFVYILRPCMIHGSGNKGNLNLLFNFIKLGIPYPFGSFKNKRSFVSVENLCFLISQLLKKDIPSGIYNIADDESLSTLEVVEILSAAIQKKSRTWSLPQNIVKKLAKIGDGLNLPFNSERLNKLTENYEVSNEKVKKAVGVNLPLSSREGLFITAKSFLIK